MKIGLIIPARFESTRFPGKPLALISGKPMIWHVWSRCILAIDPKDVYIATESTKIKDAAELFGAKVIMTSSKCLTGTDRIAEANQQLDYDFVINVQGDEPLIDPDLVSVIKNAALHDQSKVLNLMTRILDTADFVNLSIPKVVFDSSHHLLYMSRASIPVTKDSKLIEAYRQVCVYGFSKDHLSFFLDHKKKAKFEAVEDIEILRFVESSIPVKMIEVTSNNIAVDHPNDIDKIEAYLRSQKIN